MSEDDRPLVCDGGSINYESGAIDLTFRPLVYKTPLQEFVEGVWAEDYPSEDLGRDPFWFTPQNDPAIIDKLQESRE